MEDIFEIIDQIYKKKSIDTLASGNRKTKSALFMTF